MPMKPTGSTGLRQQIATAETVKDVNDLLAYGRANYKLASFKTVRQWQVTAERRIKELASAPVAAVLVASIAAPVENGRAERRRQRRAS